MPRVSPSPRYTHGGPSGDPGRVRSVASGPPGSSPGFSVEAPLAREAAFPIAATFSHVGLQYLNGTVALEDVTFAIASERITSIVGPSGCGKSTALRLLAGLEHPTAGSVSRSIETSDGRHDVAMVFQENTLLPWLTVQENVGLYQRFHPPPYREVARREVSELLRLVGLEGFAGAYPKQLSGGMLRRTAFLAGVAAHPQVLLLDEPFSAVDEPTRVTIHQEVLRIVRQLRMTTVLVTHDIAEALSLSDFLIMLSARPGRVVKVYEVPFGAERDVFELRGRRAFLDLYGEVWEDLSREIGGRVRGHGGGGTGDHREG